MPIALRFLKMDVITIPTLTFQYHQDPSDMLQLIQWADHVELSKRHLQYGYLSHETLRAREDRHFQNTSLQDVNIKLNLVLKHYNAQVCKTTLNQHVLEQIANLA